MSNPEYDKLFDHDFDGIQEYDNPLPGWWSWLFIASIVLSVCYIAYYHIGVGPSVQDSYQAEVASYYEELLAELGNIQPDNASIVRLMNNEDMMSAMGGVFRGSCAQCHADDGGGNIGPNLTDDYYKNVTEPADIYSVIADGIEGTSMPAWSQRLREPQMILLAAYVASLRDTTAAAGKEPEGSRIDPWPPLEQFESESTGEEKTAETTPPDA